MNLRLWPTRRQWDRWSLPARLTLIGTYCGIAGLALALVPFIANEQDSSPGQTVPPSSAAAPVPPKLPDAEFREYRNATYYYSVRFPRDWTPSAEYPNGSGIALFVGHPEIEIRVWGVYLSREYSPELGWEIDWSRDHSEPITLDSGYSAELYIAKRVGKVLSQVSFVCDPDVGSSVEYNLFAAMPEQIYRAMQREVMSVATSFRLWGPYEQQTRCHEPRTA